MATSLRDDPDVTTAPPSRLGRRIGVVLVVLAALGVLVGVGIVAKNNKGPLGQLRVREGTVEVQHDQLAFTRASDGDGLETGDGIRTESASQAQVDFFDGSLTRLDSRTGIVLTDLANERKQRISFTLGGGRVWNSVHSVDAFTLRFPRATATTSDATFAIDCRVSGRCYAIGVDQTTHIKSSSGEVADVGPGACAAVLSDGAIERCNAALLGLNDQWIRENLAEDEHLALDKTTPTPSPTPTESASSGSSSFHAPSSGNNAPAPAPRTQPRQPAKTAPPATARPTTDPNDDGVITTPGPISTPSKHR